MLFTLQPFIFKFNVLRPSLKPDHLATYFYFQLKMLQAKKEDKWWQQGSSTSD